MKIGVISDTHITGNFCNLPRELIDALRKCDLILHAGDLIDLCVIESLKKIAKVEAVYGNMDLPKVKSLLQDKKILTLGGKKVCLMHGYGRPKGLVELLKKEFLDKKPDIVVFGHSHTPMNKYIDGVLFFNPGSTSDSIFAPYNSYGIIEIINGKIDSSIHKI